MDKPLDKMTLRELMDSRANANAEREAAVDAEIKARVCTNDDGQFEMPYGGLRVH